MKKLLGIIGVLLCITFGVALFRSSSLNKELWESRQSFYKINQRQVGNYQDNKEDWKNSEIFKNIYIELENEYNAFICSTWNYDIIDGKPRYEKAQHGNIPIEYDYYGYSFMVSKNYFDYTLVNDINGNNIQNLLTNDENTLDIIVPIKYKKDSKLITSIYQEFMYFNNVEVENIYNEELNLGINEKEQSDFIINIIYVPDNTEYDVYNPAIKHNKIKDCIAIVINSKNYNKVQLNAIANQGLYANFDVDKEDVENKIELIYKENNYEDGYHSIISVKELYNDWKNDKFYETIVIGVIGIIGILIIVSVIFSLKKQVIKQKKSKR